jgi:cytochrome c oxidase cbb3-type subunit 4
MMDIGDLRGISTIFCMVAFAAVVYWAYGPSRKDYFEEAGNLPFSYEESSEESSERLNEGSNGESCRESNKGFVNESAEDIDQVSHERTGSDIDKSARGRK